MDSKNLIEAGYVTIRAAISEQERVRLLDHALCRARSDTMRADTRVPQTPAAYSDPHMEALLAQLLPTVEQFAGVALFPTYSYFRVYKHGDRLPRHHDRAACEFTVSLNLGCQASEPWPLWIETRNGAAKIEMHGADAVLYRGIECAHWRDPFEGDYAAQVFLHYVAQNGANSAWRYDKRSRLGTIPAGTALISPALKQRITELNVLVLPGGESVRLGEVRGAIWRGFEAGVSVPTISRGIIQRFAISQSLADSLIMDFLRMCEERELVRICEDMAPGTCGPDAEPAFDPQVPISRT